MGYYVTQAGLIYSDSKQDYVKQSNHSVGYKQAAIRMIDGTFKVMKVHRVVATAYLPNTEGKYSVNHKDGDKTNNHVDNLEWATMKENIRHAYDTGLAVAKQGAEHHKYGTKHTSETKALMSEAKKGVKHPKFTGYYVTPAGEFATSNEAGQANGINPKQAYRWCKKGKEGWSFRPS